MKRNHDDTAARVFVRPSTSSPTRILLPTKKFPGVDIDAVHYDRRWSKKIPKVRAK